MTGLTVLTPPSMPAIVGIMGRFIGCSNMRHGKRPSAAKVILKCQWCKRRLTNPSGQAISQASATSIAVITQS